eukprot:1471103-Amphidinium_carterae.1
MKEEVWIEYHRSFGRQRLAISRCVCVRLSVLIQEEAGSLRERERERESARKRQQKRLSCAAHSLKAGDIGGSWGDMAARAYGALLVQTRTVGSLLVASCRSTLIPSQGRALVLQPSRHRVKVADVISRRTYVDSIDRSVAVNSMDSPLE